MLLQHALALQTYYSEPYLKRKFQKNHTVFDVNSHKELTAEILSNLFYKDIIETSEIGSNQREEIQGLSFNFDSLEAIPE